MSKRWEYEDLPPQFRAQIVRDILAARDQSEARVARLKRSQRASLFASGIALGVLAVAFGVVSERLDEAKSSLAKCEEMKEVPHD